MPKLTRRQILLSLGLSPLALAALNGCDSGRVSNGSPLNPGGPNAGRGAVEAYVFQSPSGGPLLLSTTNTPPAGATPAVGVRAEIVGGGPSATVGADGSLRLGGIEPGLRTLRLTPANGGAPTDVPLTVVPDATLPLGQTAVSRQNAVEALRTFAAGLNAAELFTGSDVLVTSTPLPAGVRLSPALPSGDEQEMAIERPSWVLYVDMAPQSRFGHPTVLALVDAETGAVRAQGMLSWPLFNDASFYADSQVNATSPDALMVASGARGNHSSSSGNRAARGLVWPETEEGAATCRAADPETSRTHVLMIQGDRRSDFAADMEDVAVSLGVAPFPRTGTFRRIRTFEGSSGARARILQEFAAVRDAAKSGDTFVLYVTSHGQIGQTSVPAEEKAGGGLIFRPAVKKPPEQIAASYRLICESAGDSPFASDTFETLDGKIIKFDNIAVNEFDFSPCKACRIVLWIDTCYSGNWINIQRSRLEALKDRDILILTSADQEHVAEGILDFTLVEVGGEIFGLPEGGLFTNGLVEGLRRVRGSEAAETGADALAAAFPFAVSVTNENNKFSLSPLQGALQSPQLFRRPLEPDAVCGKGDEIIDLQ